MRLHISHIYIYIYIYVCVCVCVDPFYGGPGGKGFLELFLAFLSETRGDPFSPRGRAAETRKGAEMAMLVVEESCLLMKTQESG